MTTARFDKLSDSLAKRRADILSDASLSAVDRKNNLNDLHEKEIEAVEQFIKNIDAITDPEPTPTL